MCDGLQDQIETLKSPSSQNRQNFAKFMIWQNSCIFHTIATRSSIHLVQRADCHFPLETHTHCTDLMSPVKLRCYHQLSVKGLTTYGLATILLILLCVCAQRVTLWDHRQTRPLPSLLTSSIWSCHRHPCKCPPCQWTRARLLTGFLGLYAPQRCWDVFVHILGKAFLPPQLTSCFHKFVFRAFCFVLV